MTTTTKMAPGRAEPLLPRDWTVADSALWAFLVLPVPIFLGGFFIPWLGLPLAGLALWGAWRFLPPNGRRMDRPPFASWILLALLAAAWTALGGAGHLFHANGIDWVPRFAVLRDLVVAPWPPRYGAGAEAMLLRAPPGYYLPAALLGKLAGLAWLDRLLLVWTWLGVALFFCANFGGRPTRGLAAALVFAFASGLDVLGLLWREGSLPWPTQHIEWWAGGMQYSSNSTLLFWVPNHGLPGWIAGAWLWRLRDDPRFLARLPLLFLPVMLWSPLVAVGLLPLAVVAALRHWRALFDARADGRGLLASVALAVLPAALIAAYLLLGFFGAEVGANALTPTAAVLNLPAPRGDRLAFVLLEVGVFCAFLLWRDRSLLALAAVTLLLLMPWTRWGPNNDLLMRASIPALAMLWLMLAESLTAPGANLGGRVWRLALVILFALGAVTPLLEIQRALSGNRWPADTRISAPQALNGFPPHYFVAEKRNWLAPLLRR